MSTVSINYPLLYSKAQWRLERLVIALEIAAKYEPLSLVVAAELKAAQAALAELEAAEGRVAS